MDTQQQNMTKEDILRNRRYYRAAVSLLMNKTIYDAAEELHISARTMQRWMSDPGFQSILHDTQTEFLAQSARRLAGACGDAIDTLLEVCNDLSLPPGVRCRAADLVLSNALRLSEIVSLGNRVKQLERAKFAKDKDNAEKN